MGVASIIGNFASTTIKFKEFLLATIIVIGFIAIVWLITYCIRVMYIRIVWLRRSENLERFMENLFDDIQTTVSLYNAVIGKELDETSVEKTGDEEDEEDEADQSAPLQIEEWNTELKLLFGNIMSFLDLTTTTATTAKKEMRKNIEWFFKYNGIFENKIDLFLYDNIFKEFRRAEFQPSSQSSAQNSNDRGRDYCKSIIEGVKKNLIRPLPVALSKFSALEQKIYESDDFVGKQKYVDFSVGIHAINMYMSVYDKTLKGMYENRRVSFFNYFIALVRPQYEKFIIEEVVNRWRDALSAENEDTARAKFATKWKNLGKHIKEFMNSVWTKSEEIYNS